MFKFGDRRQTTDDTHPWRIIVRRNFQFHWTKKCPHYLAYRLNRLKPRAPYRVAQSLLKAKMFWQWKRQLINITITCIQLGTSKFQVRSRWVQITKKQTNKNRILNLRASFFRTGNVIVIWVSDTRRWLGAKTLKTNDGTQKTNGGDGPSFGSKETGFFSGSSWMKSNDGRRHLPTTSKRRWHQ